MSDMRIASQEEIEKWEQMAARNEAIWNNNIIIWVAQAASEKGRKLLEVYANNIKCVYRFHGESEKQAHWFMYGTSVDYPAVQGAVFRAIDSLKFDKIGEVIHEDDK